MDWILANLDIIGYIVLVLAGLLDVIGGAVGVPWLGVIAKVLKAVGNLLPSRKKEEEPAGSVSEPLLRDRADDKEGGETGPLLDRTDDRGSEPRFDR